MRASPIVGPIVALGAALALTACGVGPRYRPAPIAPAASGKFDAAARPVFDQGDSPSSWWRLYDDPALDALIVKAFAANTDLRVADANLRRARAVLREARGARLPTTDVSASAEYRRFGGTQSTGAATGGEGTTGGSGGTGTGLTGTTFESETYSVGLDVGYEIDLFGRIGRLIAAARADAEAIAAVRDTVRITVAAETTRAYADACSAARQLAVARNSLDVQSQTFDLTERLYDAGRGTPLDVARARAQLETTRATLPDFVSDRQEALYRLAVLTGDPPSTIPPAAAACTAAPLLARPLPVGDGTELIKRRPDIREADRRLAAETARIGVAIAELYPRISIGASASTSALSLGGLGKSPSIAFGIGPLLSWSFPNFTVARAQIAQARASAEAALATFDDTLLTALQDAETSLAQYGGERDRNAALRNARDLNREAVRIVRLRYTSGASSFIDVLDAERSLSTADATLAESDALLTTRQIAVFKSLGGGWEGVPEPVAPPILR